VISRFDFFIVPRRHPAAVMDLQFRRIVGWSKVSIVTPARTVQRLPGRYILIRLHVIRRRLGGLSGFTLPLTSNVRFHWAGSRVTLRRGHQGSQPS